MGKENCNGENDEHCGHNALKIAASFSAMGEYLAGAVGRCTVSGNTALTSSAECASKAMGLSRDLVRLASAGMAMKKECNFAEERLYALEHGDAIEVKDGSSSSVTVALAALLPLTAVVSFVGGSRFAKRR